MEIPDLLLGVCDGVHVDAPAGIVDQVGAEAQLQGVDGGSALDEELTVNIWRIMQRQMYVSFSCFRRCRCKHEAWQSLFKDFLEVPTYSSKFLATVDSRYR